MQDAAARGVPWTLLTFGFQRVLTFATTLALARLLTPSDFGLFALASLVTLFLTILRDLGLGAALILRRDLDRTEQATIVTMIIASGAAYTLVIAALAPLAALAFDQPRLMGLLLALSLSSGFSAVSWAYDVVMQREMAFKQRFIAQGFGTVSFAAVSLVLGFAGAGVWSFVGGTLASAVVASVASFALSPYRLPIRWNWSVAKEALISAKGFLAQGLLTVTRQNADYLVVGRVLGTAPLGLYSMGYRISELPTVGIADSVAKVTFTAFSEMRHRGKEILGSFLASLRLVALVTTPMGVMLSAGAGPVVRAVLGPEWTGLIGALAVLGIWAALRPVEAIAGWLLNSVGRPGAHAKILAAVLGLTLPGLLIAAWLGDIVTVSYVTLADMLITVPALAAYAHRQLGLSVRRQWCALRPAAIAGAVMWAAVWGADAAFGDAGHPVTTLSALTALGFGTYIAALRVIEPGVLRVARSQIARSLKRSEADPVAP
ncbi:MAG: oligosaccharide flippase family protein [Egibacteraceae bacterium]